MYCGIDESDLSMALYTWRPKWTDVSFFDVIGRLGSATIELMDLGFVDLFPSGVDDPLTRAEAAAVLANPKAWWNGDEGLEAVVWIVLTDDGGSVLSTASVEELNVYNYPEQ
jgi:hypothetical protein